MILYTPNDWYWVVGKDTSKAFSSLQGKFVDTYPEDKVAYIDTMDNLISVLRDLNIPPYHRVRKSTIIYRLTDDQLTAALGAMSVRQRERWYAPDQGYINADDPESNQLLEAIGADPSVVLAPGDE